MSDEKKTSPHFMGLVISIGHAAMQQMGKIGNPITGKMERNLHQAKISIDMLQTLKDKTQGNLTKDEDGMITKTLADLQLNYVDELQQEESRKKEEPKKKEEKQEEKKEEPKKE